MLATLFLAGLLMALIALSGSLTLLLPRRTLERLLLVYVVATRLDVTWLMPVAAGNFIYIGAADLVPELTRHAGRRPDIVPLLAFGIGLGLMFILLTHQG